MVYANSTIATSRKKNAHPKFYLAICLNFQKSLGFPEPDCREDSWCGEVAQFDPTREPVAYGWLEM
jgi:hypothetical protein